MVYCLFLMFVIDVNVCICILIISYLEIIRYLVYFVYCLFEIFGNLYLCKYLYIL